MSCKLKLKKSGGAWLLDFVALCFIKSRFPLTYVALKATDVLQYIFFSFNQFLFPVFKCFQSQNSKACLESLIKEMQNNSFTIFSF